jgi:hypothetical protein
MASRDGEYAHAPGRTRVGKEEISDEENVTEEVRKERIEAEGDVDDRNL